MVFKFGCLCIYGIFDDAEIFDGVVYVFCCPSVRFNPLFYSLKDFSFASRKANQSDNFYFVNCVENNIGEENLKDFKI